MPERFPPLNALRAFEATARNLSFSRAAVELNVTAAALSHQIRGLEAFLGTKLFLRKARAIELTEAGQLLFPGIHSGFESFKGALARLNRIRDDRVLVISVGPAFTAKWLAPRLYRFMQRHPDIDARISANLSFSDFANDGVDVAIRFGNGRYPGLHIDPLMNESVLPLCSPSLLAGPNALRKPADLAHHTLIHDESLSTAPTKPGWAHWLELVGVTGVDPTRGLRFSHADHALDAAIEGAGVVLARQQLALQDLRSGRLVAPFELILPVYGLAYYLVCPQGTEERPKIRALRDWLIEEIAATAKEIAC